MAELLCRSASELAALIRSGEVGAHDAVEQSLRAIDELQPVLGAFTHIPHDSALEEAAAIGSGDPRPFAGVPIAIKDNRPVAGMPLTMCSDLFGDFVPRHDAYVVRRLREAGFVIVGKTTLPEMGITPTTEPRRFGPTRNPWDLERTPGGSSGGSAAAVAAGAVPIAHGNDGGGSIRIPAACCGLVGLKPSRGRVSLGPDVGHSFLVVDGALTRTVADTARALDLLTGYEPGDATWAPPPVRPYAESAAREPGRLRLGLALSSPLSDAVPDPISERAARDAASLLESLGHGVEEIAPPWSGHHLQAAFTLVFGSSTSMTTWIGGRLNGREPTADDVEPLTWALWELSRGSDAVALVAAQSRLERVARSIVDFLSPYDATITPALAQRPVPIGYINGLGPDPLGSFGRAGPFTPYTAIMNITGQPAISLPLYHGEDGLPTGVQVIGRPLGEDVLLSLAGQLEQALPWADRSPPTFVATPSR